MDDRMRGSTQAIAFSFSPLVLARAFSGGVLWADVLAIFKVQNRKRPPETGGR